jgi:hypothetical protein
VSIATLSVTLILTLTQVMDTLATRSAVDLKDKWRNLLRIAMLPVMFSYKRREAAEIPAELLQRVRELANYKGVGGGGTRLRRRANKAENSGKAYEGDGVVNGSGSASGSASGSGSGSGSERGTLVSGAVQAIAEQEVAVVAAEAKEEAVQELAVEDEAVEAAEAAEAMTQAAMQQVEEKPHAMEAVERASEARLDHAAEAMAPEPVAERETKPEPEPAPMMILEAREPVGDVGAETTTEMAAATAAAATVSAVAKHANVAPLGV